ncbi:16S rRNA (cytosine(967)-C(5))-methyltransferase RsmB [Methylococcus sp. EFPC2]|uniref:16S rRNA (cytosine(967)-C(5))-methyltransferase RsmB n=1 Tax=Methylococcus sp. EFPC2 TaxID=2812648 RepID=UPI0019676C84|nr:16S rRNA (cytosine(967)-C(5))-methyltransferase RsmB [Methylococcus sp. EFPC2]QSA96809.1 16S rRNA (cytosine(967)-C(5))-methyltransferase RsmB [Methylococcus sp. EFPC2]
MNSRALAAHILAQVIGEGRSLTAALESTLPEIPAEQDRAFVQALCFGVLRGYERLDCVLRQLATRPIKDFEIRMLALLGLYQLEHTRVKPHAAVSETVAAAGRRSWAKPLLNAVLRNYQRRREELLAAAGKNESAALGHPDWLIARIRADWPEQAAAIMADANQTPPMTLRVNRRQGTREDYLEKLARAGLNARPGRHASDAVILENPVAVERLPGFESGEVSVQDEAAQLAAGLLDLQSGQRVLDVCAAPGGKTLHMLESCPDADVTALDIAPDRIARIRQNLQRAGLRAGLLTGDAATPGSWWDGRHYDRILLDAPCSATGVIRRHPDIKRLRKPEDIESLQSTQRRILEAVWPLLAPGGRLLYATCSILRAENEDNVADFVRRHPDARHEPVEADWGRSTGCGRQILTGEDGMDGFYYALLEK